MKEPKQKAKTVLCIVRGPRCVKPNDQLEQFPLPFVSIYLLCSIVCSLGVSRGLHLI